MKGKNADITIITILFILLIPVSAKLINLSVSETYEDRIQEWAIENNYVEYHPKTGEIIILNDSIKPLIDKE